MPERSRLPPGGCCAALESLEAAVERRRDGDQNEERLVERIHQLGADRSRLTNELDGVTAQARALEQVNRDVAKRLDAAIGSVRRARRERMIPKSGNRFSDKIMRKQRDG